MPVLMTNRIPSNAARLSTLRRPAEHHSLYRTPGRFNPKPVSRVSHPGGRCCPPSFLSVIDAETWATQPDHQDTHHAETGRRAGRQQRRLQVAGLEQGDAE